MFKNQKGDALTLAMGAAVFVGISVMVTIAVLSNLNAKVNRSRMVNDVEGIILYLNQILNNRDVCAHAFRTEAGVAIQMPDVWSAAIPAPVVGVPKTQVPIPRIYLTNPVAPAAVPASPPIYCRGLADGGDADTIPDSNPACPPLNNMVIRDMRFEFENDTNNNKRIYYKGNTSRYYLLTGQIEIDVDFADSMVLGGDLKARKFPLQVVVDVTGGGGIPPRTIDLCYTRESPALICAQLGGSLNPITGTCENMFGLCGVPPNRPATCETIPGATCNPPGLQWTNIYYASTLRPGMQLACNCMTVCTTGP